MKSKYFIKYALLANSKYFKEKNIARKIVIFLFFLAVIALLLIEFILYFFLLTILKQHNVNIDVVNAIISDSLFFIFIFSLISSCALLFKTFLINPFESYILTFPVSKEDIIISKIAHIFFTNILIISLFSSPIIFTYIYIYNIQFFTLPFLILVILLFILSSIFVTLFDAIWVMITDQIFPTLRASIKTNISLVVILFLSFLLALRIIPNLELLSKSKNVSAFTHIMMQSKPLSILPSSLISNILSFRDYSQLVILIFEIIVLYFIFAMFSKKVVFKLSTEIKSDRNTKYFKNFILNKELNNFFKQEKNLINSLSIFFLLIIFIALIITIGNANISSKYYSLFYVLILGSFAYILTLLSLYFIFPSLSLEKKGGWIIFQAPIKRSVILKYKYIASVIFMFVQTLVLYLIFQFFLNFKGNYFYYFIIFTIVTFLTISVIFLSLGTISPNFKNRSLQDLSTTPSALFATFLSIFYIAFLLYILYKYGFLLSLILMVIISGLIILILMNKAFLKINNMDIDF
ncbi:MAG: putative ABC transporter permease subunit [Patescibacteria group bacterium]